MESPKCPPLIRAILKTTEEWKETTMNKYEQFLQAAESVIHESSQAYVPIEAKYSINLAPPPQPSESNSTLITIYNHYTTLRMKYLPVKSKDKSQNGTENLNFYELEIFFREFNVVPRLLSREDLKLLWRRCSYERIRNGQFGVKTLDFVEFTDFIVRVGIATFSKPGMHNLIKATVGEQPTQEEKVLFFAKYLNLDDILLIRSIIAKSREGFDDEELRIRGMLRDELRQRRLNKIISLGNVAGALAVPSIGAMSTLSAIAGNEEIPPPKPFTKDSKRYKDYHTIPPTSRLPVEIQNLLNTPGFDAKIQSSLQSEELDFGYDEIAEEEEDEEETLATGVFVSPEQSRVKKGEAQFGRPLSPMRRVDQKMFEAAFIYPPTLKDLLSVYCIKPKGTISQRVELINAESPFVDLGAVSAGAQCKIVYSITNATKDFISLDMVARGIDCDAHIYSVAGPLAPGAMRSTQLCFTVSPGYRAVLAFLDVFVVRARKETDFKISCPIYFTVNPPGGGGHMVAKEPRCTNRTLPDLLHKYLGTSKVPRNLKINFSRTSNAVQKDIQYKLTLGSTAQRNTSSSFQSTRK